MKQIIPKIEGRRGMVDIEGSKRSDEREMIGMRCLYELV